MAPEQATGRPIDARTDLYAAGVVLYELVTGRVPFDADTPMAVLTKHVYEAPPPARTLNPDLPSSVDQVLHKALAKDPSARYQTAAEMAAELSQVIGKLDRDKNRSQITGVYEVGVQAFEQGHWDLAVEQLGKVVALDPDYEDATELLEAVREAQERARTEARQQIELVRQRRQSTVKQIRPPAAPAPLGSFIWSWGSAISTGLLVVSALVEKSTGAPFSLALIILVVLGNILLLIFGHRSWRFHLATWPVLGQAVLASSAAVLVMLFSTTSAGVWLSFVALIALAASGIIGLLVGP